MTQWGLDTLFNPAKRHMDEEKRRLQSTRTEVGDNSGGKRIDFESGKVTIRRQDSDDEQAIGDERADGADDAKADQAARAAGPGTEVGVDKSKAAQESKPTKEPSAAAIRAAKRRGREPR